MNANFSTVDMDETNSVEVWPGSHRDSGGLYEPGEDGKWPGVTPLFEARRRDLAPPIRLGCPAGAVAFRDHRLVHRGVPVSTRPSSCTVSRASSRPARQEAQTLCGPSLL